MKKCVLLPFLASVALSVALADPASAQHWDITAVWAGQVTSNINGVTTVTPWSAGGGGTNSSFASGNGSNSLTSAGNVTYTYTWNNDGTGQTPPDQVYLVEGGSAYTHAQKQQGDNNPVPGLIVSGTASCSAQNSTLHVLQNVSGSVYEASNSPLGASWVKKGAGGSFTDTISLSANANGNFASGRHGLVQLTVSVTGSCAIHATPYNWQHTNSDVVQSDGTLLFFYNYASTTGNISDLTSCFLHERVTYPGGDPFVAPLPFVATGANPTILPSGDVAQAMTGGLFADKHKVFPSQVPYFSQSYSADQKYQYNDRFTGETDVLVPSATAENTSTITRQIGIRVPYLGWWYSVSKSGFTSWFQLTVN